jgi:L-2-hydroxyglutarate oxidase LhgO
MKTKCLIIGAGIIGLAIARELSLKGIDTILIESNNEIGLESSFRNSAVIHAGIYYPKNSLKAKLCVNGNELLYNYCKQNSIPYKKIGKLVIATSVDQLADLEKIYIQANENQVPDITYLSKKEIEELEPSIHAIKGILSPTTGILSAQKLMLSFEKDIESANDIIYLNSRVTKGEVLKKGFRIYINDSLEPVESKYLINASGLWAQSVAKLILGIPKECIPEIYYAKGNYFKLCYDKSPFNRLIYPIPEKAGLGIHATLDIEGGVRFGPDVEWVSKIDYSVNENRKASFIKEIKKYFPSIKAEDLKPEYAGIRAKYKPEEFQPLDFLIQTEDSHGVPNLINLYGIESPGLTCSMAISEFVHSALFPNT